MSARKLAGVLLVAALLAVFFVFDLGRFFTEHALRTWEELELGEDHRHAAKLLGWLHRSPEVSVFTTREAHRRAFRSICRATRARRCTERRGRARSALRPRSWH